MTQSTPKKTIKTIQGKPTKKVGQPKTETMVYDETTKTWEVPKKIAKFSRPTVITLDEIGDSIEGIYEGMQPIAFRKTGNIGQLIVLRQQDGSMKAINAGYDIKRFMEDSGFGNMIGQWIRITLENLVDTSGGNLAPMKQYSYEYDADLVDQLTGGKTLPLTKLLGEKVGEKLLIEAANVQTELWEE